jgi:small subunit ribosomal protein S11|uniref:Small ribosomal subunit protein uS11c n=1 Tax=Cyanidiaceae sp. MX-AZ01 TaxID=1503164 RepID=A0A060A967_9RHOD|nr:ribosomal protein S11 [Cyanidiaceae sp. MX-AZ01]
MKKTKRTSVKGSIHIQSTFNNTLITVSDAQGACVCWSSAGLVGFKGAKKGTPFAAGMAAEKAAQLAKEQGMKQVDVFVKGPGAGRETAIRALEAAGLQITSLQDVTGIPHNGCRPPKRRRV